MYGCLRLNNCSTTGVCTHVSNTQHTLRYKLKPISFVPYGKHCFDPVSIIYHPYICMIISSYFDVAIIICILNTIDGLYITSISRQCDCSIVNEL